MAKVFPFIQMLVIKSSEKIFTRYIPSAMLIQFMVTDKWGGWWVKGDSHFGLYLTIVAQVESSA